MSTVAHCQPMRTLLVLELSKPTHVFENCDPFLLYCQPKSHKDTTVLCRQHTPLSITSPELPCETGPRDRGGISSPEGSLQQRGSLVHDTSF